MQLNFNALAYLAGLYRTDNSLSPLKSAGKGDPVQGEAFLKESGMLTESGIRNEAKEILEVLAEPQRSGRIAIREGNALIEKIGYRRDEAFALVERTAEGLEVTAPATLQPTLLALSQVTGMSRVIAWDLEVELPSAEALGYLGLIDLYRKTAMLGLWQVGAPDVNLSALETHLSEPVPGSLVAMVKGKQDSAALTIGRAELSSMLNRLEMVQILEGDQIRLKGDHARFAMEFLVPRAVTSLEVYNRSEDKIAGNEALVISAGLNEHLLLKFGADQWTLSLISGSYLLKLIENVLNAPELEF
jgi:hypothetical protein